MCLFPFPHLSLSSPMLSALLPFPFTHPHTHLTVWSLSMCEGARNLEKKSSWKAVDTTTPCGSPPASSAITISTFGPKSWYRGFVMPIYVCVICMCYMYVSYVCVDLLIECRALWIECESLFIGCRNLYIYWSNKRPFA